MACLRALAWCVLVLCTLARGSEVVIDLGATSDLSLGSELQLGEGIPGPEQLNSHVVCPQDQAVKR